MERHSHLYRQRRIHSGSRLSTVCSNDAGSRSRKLHPARSRHAAPNQDCENCSPSLVYGRGANTASASFGFHAIPKAPEIFQDRISLPVEESVLQAIGFIASEAVGHTDGMTRLEPLGLADHGTDGYCLPSHVTQSFHEIFRPRDGLVARLKLRFERQAAPTASEACRKDAGDLQRVN